MVSAPWQAWAMNVRKICRWEDPKETGKWLALYIILWYTGACFSSLYYWSLADFYRASLWLRGKFKAITVQSTY